MNANGATPQTLVNLILAQDQAQSWATAELMLGSFLTVLLFCWCCHQFLKVLTRPLPLLNDSPYSKAALRIEKSYKVLSWGSLMVVFLMGLVISFAEVFQRL